MKSIILSLVSYCIVFSPFALNAQFFNQVFPQPDDETDQSFLPYQAYPVNDSDQKSGLTTVVLASRPVIFRMPVAFKEDDSKIYRITDKGTYEFYYEGSNVLPKPKQGFKPVTVRTFFLEASRRGIIPGGISYKEFISMQSDEQRELLRSQEMEPRLDEACEYAHADLIYQTTPGGYEIMLVNDKVRLKLSYGSEASGEDEMMIGVKYLPYFRETPAMVKLLIDPMNNYQLSGHAYYKNINGVFSDLSVKLVQD